MNRFEKYLSKWNFKKIAIICLILAAVTILGSAISTVIAYRERIGFAVKYSQLEEMRKKTDETKLYQKIDETAKASGDVVDIILTDKDGNVQYSALESEFATDTFVPSGIDGEKKYLAVDNNNDAVFVYVKNDEFMVNSIINNDFGKFGRDYEDDSIYNRDMSSKTIYMLSRIKCNGSLIYVINSPTSVPVGMILLKITAVLLTFWLCVYWVLMALWMYKDAAGSKLTSIYWGLIGLFTNIIGFIVYKIYKRNLVTCSKCNALQNPSYMYCTYCGTQLGSRCPECSGKVSSKDSFCHHCGAKLK